MMKKKKYIAVVGTAANPITKAHRELAEILAGSGKFDRIIWIPSGMRADKPDLISAKHRIRMTELVLNKQWRKKQPTEFVIDLREARRTSTPTIALLRELKTENPDAKIIFATGVDVLVPRPEYGGKCAVAYYWKDGKSLMKNWTFAVLPREGYPHPRTLQKRGEIPAHFMIIDRPSSPLGEISSTEIRRRIAHGESFEGFVEPPVAKYIRTHGLYQQT